MKADEKTTLAVGVIAGSTMGFAPAYVTIIFLVGVALVALVVIARALLARPEPPAPPAAPRPPGKRPNPYGCGYPVDRFLPAYRQFLEQQFQQERGQ